MAPELLAWRHFLEHKTLCPLVTVEISNNLLLSLLFSKIKK